MILKIYRIYIFVNSIPISIITSGSPRKVSQSNNSIELLTSINNQYSLNEPLTFETNPVSIVRRY